MPEYLAEIRSAKHLCQNHPLSGKRSKKMKTDCKKENKSTKRSQNTKPVSIVPCTEVLFFDLVNFSCFFLFCCCCFVLFFFYFFFFFGGDWKILCGGCGKKEKGVSRYLTHAHAHAHVLAAFSGLTLVAGFMSQLQFFQVQNKISLLYKTPLSLCEFI